MTPKLKSCLRLSLVILISIIVSYIVYWLCCFGYAVRVALQAERELQSVFFACELLSDYVTKNKQWPSSWDDLENYEYQNTDSNRPHHWPEECATLKKNVTINFQLDLTKCDFKSLENMFLIETKHEGYAYKHYDVYRDLLESLNELYVSNTSLRQEVPPEVE